MALGLGLVASLLTAIALFSVWRFAHDKTLWHAARELLAKIVRKRSAQVPAPEFPGSAGLAITLATAAIGASERSTDERLKALEDNLAALNRIVGENRQDADAAMTKLRQDLESEIAEREMGDQETHGALREYAGSGWLLALLALCLVIVAAFPATVPAGTAHVIRVVIGLHQPAPRCPAVVVSP